MNLANECLECDSIKKAVVDFKNTLLIVMKKYTEGVQFIDSLNQSDFTFNYKKQLMSENMKALAFDSENDTIKRNLIYAGMVDYLENYIKTQTVTGREFDEIYTELYIVKSNFSDTTEINREIDSLKKQYPDKQYFFDFLKK